MKFNEQDYRDKGWSEEEINQAKKLMSKSHEKKHPTNKHLETALYWFLFIAIIGMGIGSAFFIEPLLLLLKPTGTYIVMGIIGLIFGTITGIIVKDIEQLERHHHLAISILLPITAIISSVIISQKVNITAKKIGVMLELHPVMMGLVFSICTLIPYILFIRIEAKKGK